MSDEAKVLKPKHPNEMAYPRNQWYVAAFSQDITSEPLGRVLLDTPVVMYRLADGTPVALYDRCPHRGLPLSMGKVVNDQLRCHYHGIEYGATGLATLVPNQAKIYPSLCVPSFAVVDKGPYLWIWLGEQASVDHSVLPDISWMSLSRDDECIVPYLTVEIDAHFAHVHDNLADASHLPYVHAGLLDESGMGKMHTDFKEEGQSVRMLRKFQSIIFLPPEAALYGAKPDTEYDRSFETSTYFPSLCIGRQILTESKTPDAKPIMLLVLNAVTPSTLSKTYIFDAQGNLFQHGSDEDKARVALVLDQDKDVWNAQQKLYDQFGDTKEVGIIGDVAGLAGRRILQRLVAQEQSARVAA